jgi:hypothetical protein
MRIELIIPIFRLHDLSTVRSRVPLCIIRHNHARPTTERESSAARLASHRAAVRRALDLPRGPPEGSLWERRPSPHILSQLGFPVLASPALEEDAPSAPAIPVALDTALPLAPAVPLAPPPRRRLPMALARAALDSSFASAASSSWLWGRRRPWWCSRQCQTEINVSRRGQTRTKMWSCIEKKPQVGCHGSHEGRLRW